MPVPKTKFLRNREGMPLFAGKHRPCVFTIWNTKKELEKGLSICNPVTGLEDYEFPLQWPDMKYICFQAEIGEEGIEHLQGYVIWSKPFSGKMCQETHPHAHWEPRKGSHKDAKVYCSKEEGRTAGPFSAGEEPLNAGKRNDALAARDAIKEGKSWGFMYENHWGYMSRYRKCLEQYKVTLSRNKRTWQTFAIVYYGSTRMGKSRKAFHDCAVAEQMPYVMPKPNGSSIFIDRYDNEEVVIMDEFDGSWFPLAFLLKLLDRYELPCNTKGGAASFCARQIIITTNKTPRQWYSNVPVKFLEPLFARLKQPYGKVVSFKEEWFPAIDCPCVICKTPERTDMMLDWSDAVDPETLVAFNDADLEIQVPVGNNENLFSRPVKSLL